MEVIALPKEEWRISFSKGYAVLTAAAVVLDDGSICEHHARFSVAVDAPDYPVGLEDLEGVEFCVEHVDPIA